MITNKLLSVILILVTQNADTLIIMYLGTESMRQKLEEQLQKSRGNPPTVLEWLVVVYIFGESAEMRF